MKENSYDTDTNVGRMENSIKEDMKILERIDIKNFLSGSIKQSNYIVSKADEVNKAIEHILSDYKRVLKENEELKNTNCLVKRYFKLKDTNTYLQKENEILKEEKDKQIERYQNMLATNDMLHVLECEKKDKIIDLMAETINNQDIDEDICMQMGQNKNCNEFENKEECKKCIKQYFENKVKEIL